jgi:hypothetical protein
MSVVSHLRLPRAMTGLGLITKSLGSAADNVKLRGSLTIDRPVQTYGDSIERYRKRLRAAGTKTPPLKKTQCHGEIYWQAALNKIQSKTDCYWRLPCRIFIIILLPGKRLPVYFRAALLLACRIRGKKEVEVINDCGSRKAIPAPPLSRAGPLSDIHCNPIAPSCCARRGPRGKS